eukprot:363426-Chlamydomonas_euryale.AAC.6
MNRRMTKASSWQCLPAPAHTRPYVSVVAPELGPHILHQPKVLPVVRRAVAEKDDLMVEVVDVTLWVGVHAFLVVQEGIGRGVDADRERAERVDGLHEGCLVARLHLWRV